MEAFEEMLTPAMSRTERQRQGLRNAIARRKLEQISEDKVLHGFITDVWDEPLDCLSPRG